MTLFLRDIPNIIFNIISRTRKSEFGEFESEFGKKSLSIKYKK